MNTTKIIAKIKRARINIRGRVQGVGFRPTVYRYAKERDIRGWVSNTSKGVIIEIEGEKEKLDDFLEKLKSTPPPQAEITGCEVQHIPVQNEVEFKILPSILNTEVRTHIPPDIAACPDCLKELLDSNDRRYFYPFLNCTNCGPRFTIVKNIPYDRESTTMKDFIMCSRCLEEYENPLDRRFHAQPIACPECGPEVTLVQSLKSEVKGTVGKDKEAVKKTIELLNQGKIVAIKGLGGFHLACDSFNREAVINLRKRKYREDKPFALMAKDIKTIKQFCEVSVEEEKLLLSSKRPVVLLKKLQINKHKPQIAEEVAPNNKYLGFMLPYTPLHYLLFSKALSVLVMTSGNTSDEPIAYENQEALSRLGNITDYFLISDRDIYVRADDSVTRVFSSTKTEMIIRRSRGYVPEPIKVPFIFNAKVLACGAHLKNTFCLAKDNDIFISHHIGDLENWETLSSFEKGIEHFKELFDMDPEIVVCDLHPDYLSAKYAEDYSSRLQRRRVIKVQHHHAHIVSCLADNHINNQKVIGVAFDGTGYGDDGNIWGGEFLVADFGNSERKAHLEYVPLVGGDQTIKEPWRMAATYLYRVYGKDFLDLDIDFVSQLDKNKWAVLEKMIEQKTNCPLTSSMGRLFDAVSALLGVRDKINYEGQAAIELEQLVNQMDDSGCGVKKYEYEIIRMNDVLIIKPAKIIKSIIEDLRIKNSLPIISAKFHNTITDIIVDICNSIREETKLNEVALSGGVFQNMILLNRTFDRLTNEGFKVYIHSRVPANDGGICLGQAVIANERIKDGERCV